MINAEKNIYLEETEIKPNRYALYVLLLSLFSVIICWLLNEAGIFRVGKTEMRIGTAIPFVVLLTAVVYIITKKGSLADPKTKYIVMTAAILFAFATTTLLTFHTTMMLLFPIFVAMLYRSRALGTYAVVGSFLCTIITPVLSYLLGTWDVPLFQELILIATNGEAVIEGAYEGISLLNIGKIALYLVFPRLLLVSSCALLLYYLIGLGEKSVAGQIELNRLSHRDFLTGLYNQNYYKEVVSNTDLKGPVGVIFFDVNGLKAANDSHGHEYGDIMIKRSAESINRVCNDSVSNGFRLGGDEFLLVMEGVDEAAVQKKLEDWEAALSTVNRENTTMYGGVHCSMAAGYVVGDFQNLERLVRAADEQMYRKKARMKKESQTSI